MLKQITNVWNTMLVCERNMRMEEFPMIYLSYYTNDFGWSN